MSITLKGILGAVTPIFAGLLPGPLGSVVQKVIGDVLGKSVTSQEEIEKLLASASPDLLIKLKQAETDFVEKMGQQKIDVIKLATEDTANARAMQLSTKSKTPAVLAGVVVVGWIGLMIYLLMETVPQSNAQIINIALGTFNSALMLVLGFYFGSSSGSQTKDETIKSLSV